MPSEGTEMTGAEEEAARKAADPDRLMKGEDPDTTFLEDALHWRSVYEELVGFKRDMIGLKEATTEVVPEPAAEEIERTDGVVLDRELHRLQDRLDFWDGKVRELE